MTGWDGLGIALMGMLGVLSRAFINQISIQMTHDQSLIFSTFLINVLGSFFIGIIFILSPPMKLALMVGFLGGFTTYSGYSLQVAQAIENGLFLRAFSVFALTPVLCLFATLAGLWVGRRFF